MTLLTPWLMLGMALLGVPILIHVLNRSRFKVENWGAMMFLQQSLKVRAQRLKVRQILLLILRALFFVFFALALARPISQPENVGKKQQPTTHVLVIDGSYSTQQGKGKEQSFGKLKKEALAIIKGMGDSDDMLIVWAGVKPRPLFEKPIYDKDVLQRHLEALEPGDESMDLSRAFDKVFWLLAQSHQPRHRIYLLSDGQAHNWRDTATRDWEQLKENYELLKVKPTVYCLSQTPKDVQHNLAVNTIYPRSPVVDVFRQTTFLAEVINHGKIAKNAKISFHLNDRLMAEKPFLAQPGSNTIDFTCRIDQAGSNHLRASLGPDDLRVDNQYVLALHVMKQIPILLLEGDSSENPTASDGLIMSAALDAAARPGEANLLAVTRRNHLDAQDIDLAFLNQFKAVVLTDVPFLSQSLQDLLKHYVRKGGGLMICLGPDIAAEAYNSMFAEKEGLLPGKLVKIQEREKGQDFYYPVFPAGVAAEVLTVFDLKRTRELKEVRVSHYWQVEPAEDAITVARFDSDPFLLKRTFGEGSVVLWTTSANMEWTNFPVTPDFLPLTQDLALFLSAGVNPPVNLAQGETLLYSSERPITGEPANRIDSGSSSSSSSKDKRHCLLTTPDGEEKELPMVHTGDEWIAQWDDTLAPGLYTVTSDNDVRHFAVNVDGQEGALEAIKAKDRSELKDHFPIAFVDTQEELKALIAEEIGVREYWQLFVFIAIALLTIELTLGWRFNA